MFLGERGSTIKDSRSHSFWLKLSSLTVFPWLRRNPGKLPQRCYLFIKKRVIQELSEKSLAQAAHM
jgi:hypothetical protein